ncbi:MAG: CDP-alcohol phosphatidyltransferase family protein [Acidobacteriota bacterium]|nr:CDP-alcohol phosphatidyltransferase family protein [Acidobacteriota bacterium]MDH3783967.1 CDP-alcohol phosphatidyltransferase family protein [Acidobacteriota bacterium]
MNAKRLLANLNLANQLTFLRLAAVPFFILSILEGRFDLALLIFVGAAVTDFLDGWTARVLNAGTPLGAWLDPAADKLLLTSAFILLTDYPRMFQDIDMVARLPVWLTVLTISRDACIVGIAFILTITHAQRRFKPSIWGKLTTAVELITIGGFLLANALQRTGLLLEIAIWTTLTLTLISGFHYMIRTIRMLQQDGTAAPPGPHD